MKNKLFMFSLICLFIGLTGECYTYFVTKNKKIENQQKMLQLSEEKNGKELELEKLNDQFILNQEENEKLLIQKGRMN